MYGHSFLCEEESPTLPNPAATGKATYSNFGVYGAKAINGVGAVSNHDFTGTAEAYIPGHPAAKYLYVWKVTRRALGDPRCLEVKWGIGPYWSEVLYDGVIKFSPSQ